MLTGHRGIRAALVGLVSVVALGGAGLTSPAQAVVHGEAADTAQFPFLLALVERAGGEGDTFNGRFNQFCGASLVGPRRAITAAHCVDGEVSGSGDLFVVATPRGSKNETDSQVREVTSFVIHPRYDSQEISNDIAVLMLDSSLVGVPYVVPSSDDSLLSEADVWSAGWGSTTRDTGAASYPDMFRVAPMVAFPSASCGADNPVDYTVRGHSFNGLSSADINPLKQICAQGFVDSQIVDTCVGDSGGPLIAGSGAQTRLVGVVSWGPDLCASNDPGVYTRVSAYRRFLEQEGVTFDAPAVDEAQEPVLVGATPSPSKLIVKVHAAPGDTPTAFWAVATDAQGGERYCVVAAAGSTNVTCVITGLANGTRYRVTTWAVDGWSQSTRTASIMAAPASKPGAPMIDVGRSKLYATYAMIKVKGFVSNGSPITSKYVRCTVRNHPTLTAAVNSLGFAKVTKLVRGGKYSCRAYAVNAVGTSLPSAAVTFTV